MLVREALEAADARGTDLLEILAALSPCKFQENTPADGAYVGFDVRHFLENTLDPRLQSYIMMSQKKAEWAAGPGMEDRCQPFSVIVHVPVKSSQAKSTAMEERGIPFENPPTFNGLLDEIEKEDLSVRLSKTDFQLKAGNVMVTKENWEKLARGTTQITLEVILKEPKPLSSFSNEEGLELLLGPKHSEAKTLSFPKADINTEDKLSEVVSQAMDLATVGDVLCHLGADLAMRCLHGEPHSYTKEYARREVISPLLYAASVLSGDLALAAEFKADGLNAAGRVDFVILLNNFVISIIEGKLHDTLREHEGQCWASMQACREQYLRNTLKKRKREPDPMTEVPTVGILTNGTAYLFYKGYHDGQMGLDRSDFMPVNLKKGITAKEARDEVMDVLTTMIQLFKDQIEAIKTFQAKQASH